MNEKETIMVLKALGAKETTSRTQKKNGTSEWTLSTGEVVTEHSNGYVRKKTFDRYGRVEGCYQINGVRTEPNSWVSKENGETYHYDSYIRIMLPTRAERLERLLKFAARKLNKRAKFFEEL
jgi:hypothetical protein